MHDFDVKDLCVCRPVFKYNRQCRIKKALEKISLLLCSAIAVDAVCVYFVAGEDGGDDADEAEVNL